MDRAERKNYLYRTAFFGTIAVSTPYLMRVEAIGRHVLNPTRLGPLTLGGSVKPMVVSVLSGLAALYYLFKGQNAHRLEELRGRGESEEVRQQLVEAQDEIVELRDHQPPEPDRSEELRLTCELDDARDEITWLENRYEQLRESVADLVYRKMDAVTQLRGALEEAEEENEELKNSNEELDWKLRVALEEVRVYRELLKKRLPENGYSIHGPIVDQLIGLRDEMQAPYLDDSPSDESNAN